MHLSRLNRSLVVVTAAISLSCGGSRLGGNAAHRPDARGSTCADVSSGLDGPSCGDPGPAAGRRRRLVHNNQHENGLTPEALGCAEHLLSTIARSPLRTATLEGLSGPARQELVARCPHARELMKYVVSCALAPGESVSAGDGCEPWPGEVGLCKTGEFGDWASSAPTTPCLEIVSSCVLARANALDKQIALSLRGPNPALGTLPKVPVETHYRHKGGKEMIKSFRPCDPRTESASPARNCGFQPRHVGRCEADADAAPDVKLTVKGPPGQAMMVRVCAGIHGCDHGEERIQPSYAEWITEGTIPPGGELTFDCPTGHVSTTDKPYGYYSVMIAAPAPGGAVPCDVDVQAKTEREGSYPASEEQVFTLREGAFYGNLFLSDGGPAKAGRRRGAKGQRMLTDAQFACYTKESKNNKGDLYLARRLCMSPAEGCFSNAPEPCWTSCEETSAPGTGYLQSCKGGPVVWKYPITTYLNQPDDLVE